MLSGKRDWPECFRFVPGKFPRPLVCFLKPICSQTRGNKAAWFRTHALYFFIGLFLLITVPTLFVVPKLLSSPEEPPQPNSEHSTAKFQPSALSDAPEEQLPSFCASNERRTWTSAVGDVWIPLGGNLSAAPPFDASIWLPKFCIVAQTSASHSPFATTFSIDRFIASLLLQTDPRWQLVIVDLSGARNESFPYLHEYLHTFSLSREPSRIRIINGSMVGYTGRTASHGPDDTFSYIWSASREHCSLQAERVMLTEANHWFHPEYLEQVMSQSDDVIGVDFYSNDALGRIGTGAAATLRTCSDLVDSPPCSCNSMLPNELRGSSLAFNFAKWVELGQLEVAQQVSNCSRATGSPSLSCLLSQLLSIGWSRGRVPQCLISLSPNPHLCALYGNVVAHTAEFSSATFMCVPSKDIAELLIQETVEQFDIPFFESSCFHASRLGAPPPSPRTDSPASDSPTRP